MKRIILCTILVALALACSNELKLSDEAQLTDKELVRILSYTLVGNDKLYIELSEVAMLAEYEYRGVKHLDGKVDKSFLIKLEPELALGEVENLSFTIKKASGMATRASLRLIGKNPDIPDCIINELSIKGTSTAPDRIEVLILSDGNMNGVAISDDLYLGGFAYRFPELHVYKGDIIVLYWNIDTEEQTIRKKDGTRAIYLNAGSPDTLISTDGMVAMFKDLDGEIIDAIIYSNDIENEENPYGTEKLEAYAEELIERGEWEGGPVDSSLVTSSRVLARFPSSTDSNSAEDWFTTAPRKSTFGEVNTLDVYMP